MDSKIWFIHNLYESPVKNAYSGLSLHRVSPDSSRRPAESRQTAELK